MRLKKTKVLIVDDDAGVQEVIRELLECEGGYEITIKSTCEEAEEHLAQHEVDVQLVDVKMPGKGGIEYVKSLEDKNVNIPTVIVTGCQEDPDLRGYEVVGKPFMLEDLHDAIRRVLK